MPIKETGFQTNRDFWKLIEPFLTNKGFPENAEIMLGEKDKIVTEEKGLVRVFNDNYVNIKTKETGK